ncbi:unnamed protein product, partial [Prorocentrum cordatum]
QVKSIVMGVQKQVSVVEQGLHEKVGPDRLQALKSALTECQAQITGLDQSLQEKAPLAEFQQLRSLSAGHETKLAAVEQAVQERSEAVQKIFQLDEALQVQQAKVASIERGVWEGMDCVQAMDGVITGMKTQASNLERALQDKIGKTELQQVSDVCAAIKAKV